MSEESYASIYRKAVREAEQQERGMQLATISAEKRRDAAETYQWGKKPPKDHRVYKHGQQWVGETSYSYPDWWGGFWWTRAAAVNACWRHSVGHSTPGSIGGKRRHGPWGALVKRAIAKQGKEAGELHRRAMTEDPLYEAQRRAVAAHALAENTGHLTGARRRKILRKLRQARAKLLVVSGGKESIATAAGGTVGRLTRDLSKLMRK